MAKKKSAAEFNVSEEIRNLVTANPDLTGKDVVAALQQKYPNNVLNEKSVTVAFSAARMKLGLPSRARRKKGGAKRVVRKRLPSAERPSVDMATLQAAAKFLAEARSAETAIAAVKQVQALQIK